MTDFSHWETRNGTSKYKISGMLPIAIEQDPYFITHMTIDIERDIQQIGTNSATTGMSIAGEMLLFCQPELPVQDDADVPEPVTMEMVVNNETITIDKALFWKCRELPGYDRCEAAYIEFFAEGLSSNVITKDINSRLSI